MKKLIITIVLLCMTQLKTSFACEATFIPTYFEPLTGVQVKFLYWGDVPFDTDWDYIIDYGDGTSDLNTSGTITGNVLGDVTYSTPGVYTVEVTLWEPSVCTTSYSLTLIVTAPDPDCPATFLQPASEHTCLDTTIDFSVTLFPYTDPADLEFIEWYPGDGSVHITTDTVFSYTYSEGGKYYAMAKVFVDDGTGGVCSRWSTTGTRGFSLITIEDGDAAISTIPAIPVVGSSLNIIYSGAFTLFPPTFQNDWQYKVEVNTGSGWPGTPGSYSDLDYEEVLATYSPVTTGGEYCVALHLSIDNEAGCRSWDTLCFTVSAEACDTCNSFRPIPTERYWFSAWVQQDEGVQVPGYDEPMVILTFDGGSPDADTLYPEGMIIDGWQRVAGEFSIPTGTYDFGVNLVAGTDITYYDDVRIHPFNGSMKSYVYDGETFWLVAELDDNNYATIYEYDAEGGLVRIKKETSGGIVTIQETRSNTVKISVP